MNKDVIMKLACGCGASIDATYPVGFTPYELGRWLDLHKACCSGDNKRLEAKG